MSDQNNTVEFIEDPAKYRPEYIQSEIKGISIEGWIYKKIPGSLQTKRFVLLIIICVLLLLSARFALLAYMNTSEERIKQDFEERVNNTRLK